MSAVTFSNGGTCSGDASGVLVFEDDDPPPPPPPQPARLNNPSVPTVARRKSLRSCMCNPVFLCLNCSVLPDSTAGYELAPQSGPQAGNGLPARLCVGSALGGPPPRPQGAQK